MRVRNRTSGAQTASRWRGIGRYSLALAETMARMRGEHEIVIVLSDAFPELVPLRSRLEPLVGAANVKVWSVRTPVRGADPNNAGRRDRAEVSMPSFPSSIPISF